MRQLRTILGILAAVAGLIWTAQGLGLAFAPRSFMTRDTTWVLIGVVFVLGGVGLAAWSWRRR